MILHSDNHLDNVANMLGVQAGKNSGRVGIEIETGWADQASQTRFLTMLEAADPQLTNKCISKYDGTIGKRHETVSSEIVSAPMTFEEVRKFTETVGQTIERLVDRGLVTNGAGIHIHVSEGMFEDDALWRNATAICHNGEAAARWAGLQNLDVNARNDYNRRSDVIHEFWDALALRGQVKHCKRGPYENVKQVRGTKDHDVPQSAFIHGRTTPTFETRIFRTPKSHRVLLSYIDAVESLMAFSRGAELLGHAAERNAMEKDRAQLDMLNKVRAQALAPQNGYNNQIVYINPINGDRYLDKDVQVKRNMLRGKIMYYPSNDLLRAWGQRVLTDDEERTAEKLTQLLHNDTGAVGWANGLLPLDAYMQFVIDNAKKYPHLAQRFGYTKFTDLLAPKPKPDGEKMRREPHLEFRVGCEVRIEEDNRDRIWTLVNQEPTRNAGMNQWRIYNEGVGTVFFNVNLLNHVCPGAVEPGGEV